MFATIFAFVCLTTYAAAEIPSYIHICGRKDPKLSQCIVDNVNNLKSKLCKGMPEFDIPSSDPFIIEKLALTDTTDIKLYIRDAKVTGFCDFKITNFTVDIDKLHFEVDIIFDQIRGNTTYDFNLRLLVPVARKGQLYLTSDNMEAQASFDLAIITKRGKRYTYLSKLKLNIDMKDYNAQYDLVNGNSDQLYVIIRHFVGTNKKEILKSLKPAFEEIISKRVILIANSIVKHFTYEELFPDRI